MDQNPQAIKKVPIISLTVATPVIMIDVGEWIGTRKRKNTKTRVKSALEEKVMPGVGVLLKRNHRDDSRPNIVVEVMYKTENSLVEILDCENQQ